MSEVAIKEHLKRLEVDLRMLIDHELRTPLSSVAGYAVLLGAEPLGDLDRREYLDVINTEVARALEATQKISLALYTDQRLDQVAPLRYFDAAAAVLKLCTQIQERAPALVGAALAKSLRVAFSKSTDQPCLVHADQSLFDCAVWEVLKNAAANTRSGHVAVRVYTAQKTLVIDIEDDGGGVSIGAEDLIFLRFYQDPGLMHKRRGRRGLGLGLFLARHIAEQHLGQLFYIRQKSSSLFRFLWPLGEEGESWPIS